MGERRLSSRASVENRLLRTPLALAVLIFLLSLVTMPTVFGWGVLWFAAVPLAMTGIVWALLRLSSAVGHRWPRIVGIALCSLVVLAVFGSFVLISFALLPTCALLIAACAQPAASAGAQTAVLLR